MSDVTRLLDAAAAGESHAAAELLPLVYDELRKLAAARMAQENAGQTLQATALVHEAYVRLVAQPGGGARRDDPHWSGRAHFFAAAAEAMRRILVDTARRKRAARHGGASQRRDLLDGDAVAYPPDDDLIDLDEALDEFASVDPQSAELVKLRVFAGATLEDTARVLGISTRTAKRGWAYARAWLGRRLGGPDAHTS